MQVLHQIAGGRGNAQEPGLAHRPAEPVGNQNQERIEFSCPAAVNAYVARFNFDARGAQVPFILVVYREDSLTWIELFGHVTAIRAVFTKPKREEGERTCK